MKTGTCRHCGGKIIRFWFGGFPAVSQWWHADPARRAQSSRHCYGFPTAPLAEPRP